MKWLWCIFLIASLIGCERATMPVDDPEFRGRVIVYANNGEILKEYDSLGYVYVSAAGVTFVDRVTLDTTKIQGGLVIVTKK